MLNVLVIVAVRDAAMQAGMSTVTHRHRTTPEVRFWWPQLHRDVLQGQRFDVIVLDPEAELTSEQREWIFAFCTYATTLWIDGQPGMPIVTP